MSDPLIAAERYRSEAANFSELAKNAANPFMLRYFDRLARQYLMLAESEERVANITNEFAAGRHQDGPISDSPIVQAGPEAGSPEEASASVQPASPAPLQPAQSPTTAPRRRRRRDKGRV
jgi:hypothetical protein